MGKNIIGILEQVNAVFFFNYQSNHCHCHICNYTFQPFLLYLGFAVFKMLVMNATILVLATVILLAHGEDSSGQAIDTRRR